MLLTYASNDLLAERNNAFLQPVKNYCNTHAFNESFDVANKLNSYATQAETYLDDVNKGITQNISAILFTSNYDKKVATTFVLSNIINSAFSKKLDQQAYNKNLMIEYNKLTLGENMILYVQLVYTTILKIVLDP
jgi:hypothetical protein